MRLKNPIFGADSNLSKTDFVQLENNPSDLHEHFFLPGFIHQLHQIYRDLRSDRPSSLSNAYFALSKRYKDSPIMNATNTDSDHIVEHPKQRMVLCI